MAEAEVDALPERIGRNFRVESLPGQGGTSRVLQVVDDRTIRRLALKQALSAGGPQRARRHALFRQEFEHYAVVSLRGSDGRLQGVALLRVAPGAAAEARTQGLCTVLADVLAEQRPAGGPHS